MNKKIVLKKLFWFIFAAGLFLFPNNSFANNLLTNPAFEDQAGALSGWTNTGPNFIAQQSVVYSGTTSTQDTINIQSIDFYAALSQTKSFTAGQTAYATAYCKTAISPLATTAVAGLKIEFLNSSNIAIGSAESDIRGNNNWRQLYVSSVAPAGTTQVKLYLLVFASRTDTAATGGIAYFDEAVLSTDVIPAPPKATNLINSDFENGFNEWKFIYSPGFTIDNVAKYQGIYSAKNTIKTNLGFDYFSSAYQDLQYLTGKVYAAAYVKTNMNAASSARAGLLLEYYNTFTPVPSNKLGESKTEVSGINDWRQLLAGGIVPPTGTVMIRVHVYGYAVNGDGSASNGTINFDNVVFSYSPIAPQDYRLNLLNSQFSNGLNDWSEQYGFPAAASSTAYSAPYSAQKTIGVISGQNYYSQIYQDLYANASGTAFTPGIKVYASAYVKTNINPISKATGGLQIEFIDAQGQVLPIGTTNHSVGGNTDWRYLSIAATVPTGAIRARVSGFGFASQSDSSLGGDIYFDDFVFSLAPLPSEKNQTTLLNPGFENGTNDWKEFYKPAVTTSAEKYAGTYSTYFEVDSRVFLLEDYYGSLYQEISATTGKTVTASTWVKTNFNPLYGPAAGIELAFYDTGGQELGVYNSAVSGTNNWKQLTVSGTAPSGSYKARITVFLSVLFEDGQHLVGSRAYFDEVTLNVASGCLLAGTNITMADGSQKPIESIAVGDNVLSYDEASKEIKPGAVSQIFVHDKENTYLIINHSLKVTPIHRMLSKGEWVEVGKMKVGDTLTNAKNEDVVIDSIETVNELVPIYNFEVSPYHTYVAGGFIVHNRKHNIDDGGGYCGKKGCYAQ